MFPVTFDVENITVAIIDEGLKESQAVVAYEFATERQSTISLRERKDAPPHRVPCGSTVCRLLPNQREASIPLRAGSEVLSTASP